MFSVHFLGGGSVQWQEGRGARPELQSWFSALGRLFLPFHESVVRIAAPEDHMEKLGTLRAAVRGCLGHH